MEKYVYSRNVSIENRVIYYGNDAISITYYTEKMKENSFLFYRLRPDPPFYSFLDGMEKAPF